LTSRLARNVVIYNNAVVNAVYVNYEMWGFSNGFLSQGSPPS